MNKRSIYKSLLFAGCCGLILSCSPKNNKTIEEDSFVLETRDLVRVANGSSGMEGPAVKDGILYFVNAGKNGNIGRIDLSSGEFTILIDSLPNGSIGNGIRFNKAGDMFVADYTNHNVLKVDPISGDVSVYAHEENMNQPNDLAISSNGFAQRDNLRQ